MMPYKKHLKTLRFKPSTLKGYLWHLEKFLVWLGEERMTEPKLKNYFQYLLKKYKRVNTINLRLKILNHYLKFLDKRFRFKLLSDEEIDTRILNDKQLQEFLNKPLLNKSTISLRDKAILELLYSTGLKVSQLIKLKRQQIDEIKKEIILDTNIAQAINNTTWFYLSKYLSARQDEISWLFINFDRSNKSPEKNLTVRSIERIIYKYAKGINPPLIINPQILRNTLAYKLKSEGANSAQIQSALHFKTKIGAHNYIKRI